MRDVPGYYLYPYSDCYQGTVTRKLAKSCIVVPAGGVNIPVRIETQEDAVILLTEYPPDLNTVVFTVRPWHWVHVDCTRASVTVDVGVQDCERTGVPPVQPEGDDAVTVLVCVPLDWQVPQAEYVNEVQVGGT
jgi:hypothetical protein